MFVLRSVFVRYDEEGSHKRPSFIPLGCFVFTYLRGTGEPTPANKKLICSCYHDERTLLAKIPPKAHPHCSHSATLTVSEILASGNKPAKI